jgi:hypothetical protein
MYCVGSKDTTGGKVLWRIAFPSPISAPAIADVDGSGELSILVTGSDGKIYCVR